VVRPAGLRLPSDQGLHTLRMDRNAYRDDNRTDQPRTHADQCETYPDQRGTYPDQGEGYPDQPETYWRRRAATLAAGLGVIGLLAWALSGGGGMPAGTAAQNSPASGALSAPAGPGASASAQAPVQASAQASSGPSSPAAAGADAAVPGLAAASTTGPGERCAPGSVVLSLFGGSPGYPAGQDPDFGVDAVSTAPGTCTFGLGPTQLHLVVMSSGRVIWDSADCARDNGTQLSRLTRGVPVQESFTWNRAITLPGCVTLASSARPGTYSAQARAAAIASGVYTFRLVR
jgi:hypothetical protein